MTSISLVLFSGARVHFVSKILGEAPLPEDFWPDVEELRGILPLL